MYLQNDFLIVEVGGIRFSTHRDRGTNFLLDETAVVGLDDGVDVRRNFTPRQIRSGDFEEHGRQASRYLSFSGVAVASSVSELHEMRDQFSSAVPFKAYRTLSVRNGVGTRYTTVSISGKTSWIQQNDTSAVWKIDMYAPDPNLYGLPQTVTIPGFTDMGGMKMPISYPIDYSVPLASQPVFVTNNGNMDAWPVFVVTGDYSKGFQITDNLGNTISYTGIVTKFSPVTIDTFRGSATQDGVDRSTFLEKREWFALPAGVTLQPSFIPYENVIGWCDIIFRDTWI